jgi:serine/threonine protein kinase/Flp pilus assembly protein TadD
MNIYPPGSLIAGRYEVASRPMMGGMGVVYFCLDKQENRPVALKTFRPEFLPDRDARDRFLREGTTWINLKKHPHIVRAYSVEHIKGQEVYLVLELVGKEKSRQNASLRSWLIPGESLSLQQTLLFGLQIARAMRHATSVIPGLVHQDLKPENVLVGEDHLTNFNINRVRVTDFGLAEIFTASGKRLSMIEKESATPESLSGTQLSHGVIGTPLYMAPEQWEGKMLGPETDIYAFGCMLVEMLTGKTAVQGKSFAEIADAHKKGKLLELPINTPDTVIDIVQHCVNFSPVSRYGSWAEVEDAIAHAYFMMTGQTAPEAVNIDEESSMERIAAAWSYNSIGTSYYEMGKYRDALDYFEQTLKIGRIEGEQRLEMAGLGNLGSGYNKLGDLKEAIQYHESALTLAHSLADRITEGSAMSGLGLAYIGLGNTNQAIAYFERHLAIAKEDEYLYGEGVALGNLGLAYYNLGDFHRAIIYEQEQLVIVRKLRNQYDEGTALGNLGDSYFQLGDNLRALECYQQWLTISRRIGDRDGEGRATGGLANVYWQLGDTNHALDFNEKSLAIAREIGDRQGEATSLGNLGNVYWQRGDARMAISYYEQQLEIARALGDQHNEARALGNLGTLYSSQADIGRAVSLYEQAISISKKINDLMYLATVSLNLSLIYQEKNRINDALLYAEQSAKLFDQLGHREYSERAHQLILQLQKGEPVNQRKEGPSEQDLMNAFQAFLSANSAQGMRKVTELYPLVTQPTFLMILEQFIATQASSENKAAYKQRLIWLQQIAGKQTPDFFSRMFGKKG